jgi:predicted flavoprotein YhiN
MIEPFIKKTELDPYLKINTLTKAQRQKIVSTLKGFTLPLKRLRPIDEAVITRGGVEVRELVPKTMESKLIPGLYFAGEVIDVDAYTGGFNLQIAYSTGYLAGKSAAES